MEKNNKNDESAVNILLNISSDLFIDQINFNTDNCEIDTNEKILSCKLNENWNDQDVNVKSIFSWTSEEEAIIIREYRKNPKKYAEKAKEYLFGRSKGAIIKRWNNVLKKNHPNLIIKNNVSWTPDEDEIIIREYKKNPTNFVKNASQSLLGRTDSAVGSRWKNVLRKKHYPNLITKTNVNWTPDEDDVIIREYKKNPSKYSKKAAEYLKERSEPAIILRLNKILKKEHNAKH